MTIAELSRKAALVFSEYKLSSAAVTTSEMQYIFLLFSTRNEEAINDALNDLKITISKRHLINSATSKQQWIDRVRADIRRSIREDEE